MSTATADIPTVQQAFEAAKTEHSAPAQNEPAVDEASPATGDAATQPDEAQAQPPATDSAAELTDFLSDDEVTALKAKHPNDPDALAREFKAAYTKKTQALATERAEVKELLAHKDFIAALKSDPTATLTQVAEQLGMTLTPKTAQAFATEQATTTAQTAAATVVDKVRAALGPELDFLAEPLSRVITDALTDTVGQAIEPLKSSQQALLDKAASEQQAAVMQAFEAKHPDWKQHEPAMTALMGKLQPKGMEPGEYLDTLYAIATKDIAAATAAQKAVARMTKVAQQDEGKTTPLSGDKVATARPANPSVRDAFEAAKRGERWD